MIETWINLPGHERYQISDHGRIRKKINMTHPERNKPYHYMKFETDKDGYKKVTIKGKRFIVHRLVYQAFVGELKPGLVVCHLNNKRDDNRPSNLIQATQKENIGHKVLHGTHPACEKHPRASITNDMAKKIRYTLAQNKLSLKQISSLYDVSFCVVADISRGKSWRQV